MNYRGRGALPAPLSSTTAGTMPKNGREADPGFMAKLPGRLERTWEPVSVCQ